jgi:hypothetical protein
MKPGRAIAERVILKLEGASEPKLEHDRSANALMRRYRKLKGPRAGYSSTEG